MSDVLPVVVGLIVKKNEILIAKRSSHQSLAGFWEFPGGKIEEGETQFEALSRELREELGIEVKTASPFLSLEHRYSDKKIRLFVWHVLDYVGVPFGKESQEITWTFIDKLDKILFPEANKIIIQALISLTSC